MVGKHSWLQVVWIVYLLLHGLGISSLTQAGPAKASAGDGESSRTRRLAMREVLEGFCQEMDGNFLAAIAAYSRAIEIDPKDTQFYRYRSNCFRWNGDDAHAIADLDQAIRLDATCLDAYRDRARIYQEKGNLSKAIADYTTAIHFYPKDTSLYYKRASAYLRSSAFCQAVCDYDEIFV
jgi:tetratricopeptide (TPR) repeat protein